MKYTKFDFISLDALSCNDQNKVALIRRLNDIFTKNNLGSISPEEFDDLYDKPEHELFWCVNTAEEVYSF
jgi:hypothetical protein